MLLQWKHVITDKLKAHRQPLDACLLLGPQFCASCPKSLNLKFNEELHGRAGVAVLTIPSPGDELGAADGRRPDAGAGFRLFGV